MILRIIYFTWAILKSYCNRGVINICNKSVAGVLYKSEMIVKDIRKTYKAHMIQLPSLINNTPLQRSFSRKPG